MNGGKSFLGAAAGSPYIVFISTSGMYYNNIQKQVIRVQKLVGLPLPALELLSVQDMVAPSLVNEAGTEDVY